MSRGTAGVMFLNNTMLSEFLTPTSGNLHMANNLILGQNAFPEIFAVKPGSAAVDKGKLIPQVTDGYAGQAPDLGAFELGQPMPHYGPRFAEGR